MDRAPALAARRSPSAGTRVLLVALLRALSLVVPATGGTALAAEVIERFDVAVDVGADGTLSVRETIVVHAEGREIRRGIYRDFPLRFEDAEGRLRRVGFELTEVRRNGVAEPHFVRRNDRGVRIYIGDANRPLPPGRHGYELRYSTWRQVRHLAGHTELFWNVTGNEWAFPIESATAAIRLPAGATPVRWTAYTGRVGARGEDWRASLAADGILDVAATRTLAPGEGLSVVVGIPAGVVSQPRGLQALRHAAIDHRRYLLAGLGLAGVLAFYLVAWHLVGRDPPKGVTIPRFHPPEGVSPGLAAYVHQWGWRGGWRELTAAAVSLAVKGLVAFEGDADRPTLVRTALRAPTGAAPASGPAAGTGASPPGPDLPAGERTLLSWLERNAGRVTVDRASGPAVASALASFKGAIEKENRHRFFRSNRGHFFAGLALTVATAAGVLSYGDLSEAEIALLVATCVVGAVAGSVIVRMVRAFLAGRRAGTIVVAAIHVAALGWFVFLFLTVRGSFSDDALPPGFGRGLLDALLENGFPFALVGGFALLNGLFYYLLRAPTVAGQRVMEHLDGLRLYMEKAEGGRLSLVDAPEITTERFERLLPYAIALGVEKPWAEAFESAFARAHPGQDAASAWRPAWRAGDDWPGRGFARSVAGMVSATQGSFASAVPPPRSSSSGFSGGGGSGGGGGGGGGGGW